MIETLLSLSLFISQPVRVAVIDTGYNKNNYYNANFCKDGHKDVSGDNLFVNDIPTDPHGHGTAIAGLIHQYATGVVIGDSVDGGVSVEQEKKISKLSKSVDANYCIAMIKYGGAKKVYTLEELLTALDYVAENDFDILNLSLGGYSFDPREAMVVKKILDKGTVVVAAAGNDNVNLKISPFYPGMYYPTIEVVGSYSDGNKNDHSPILNEEKEENVIYRTEGYYAAKYGKSATSNFGEGIDVWMPGYKVISLGKDGNIEASGGTSQAAASYTGYLVKKMIERKKNSLRFLNQNDILIMRGN